MHRVMGELTVPAAVYDTLASSTSLEPECAIGRVELILLTCSIPTSYEATAQLVLDVVVCT